MSQDSRTNMVRSAAKLIRTRGVSATSFSEVLADSGAPRGSIYHHFPRGKEQLTEDAIKWINGRALAYMGEQRATTAAAVLERFTGMWRQIVVASGGTAGCVVAGVAIDSTPEEENVMRLVRATFQSWVEMLAAQFHAAGITPRRARAIAITTLASMEGALILCRAERSVQPLDTVAAELKLLLHPNPRRRRESVDTTNSTT